MKLKQCNTCKEEKSVLLFSPSFDGKFGVRGSCKGCCNKKAKDYRVRNRDIVLEKGKQHYYNNKDYYKNKHAEWVNNNFERNKENAKKYRDANKDRISKLSKEYNIRNKERIRLQVNAYSKKKRSQDVLFKLKGNIRTRMRMFLNNRSIRKPESVIKLLGTDIETVKKHIEKQFKKGMRWNNYGAGHDKWNLDHILPLSLAKTEEDLARLSHYTNLQPMWAKENQEKKNKTPVVQMTMTI